MKPWTEKSAVVGNSGDTTLSSVSADKFQYYTSLCYNNTVFFGSLFTL